MAKSKYKQVKITFNIYETKLGYISINDVVNDIKSVSKNFDVREILSLFITLSKEVFTTKHIQAKTGYGRQTISEIHNMKYNIHSARTYIYYMSRELKKLGYDVPTYDWYELYKLLSGY